MSLKKLVLVATVASALVSSAVFANKVEFSAVDGDGSFYCEVNTLILFKKVDIHTDGLEVKGFCNGEEYVERSGHIAGMPMSELKKYYFDFKKNRGRKASVDIVATDAGDISCHSGQGEDRKLYGKGDFC